MNRGVIFVIIVSSLALFAGLVHYGWTHRWGGPMDTEVEPTPVLVMPLVQKALTLDAEDFDDAVWKELRPLTISLLHQVTVAPTGTSLVPQLDVRAFHNGKEAYFLFEWKDEVEARTHDTGQFPDAVAVAFSLAKEATPESIMMGFQSPVNMWQWKANLDSAFWDASDTDKSPSPNAFYTYESKAAFTERAPKVTSACQDLLSGRPGTVTLKEKTAVSGRGRWQDGLWRVIVRRDITTDDAQKDIQLVPGKIHITFAVWNGDKGDRGSRKSICDWVILDIQAGAPQARRELIEGRADSSWETFSLLPKAFAGPANTTPDDQEPRVITILAKRFVYNPSQITIDEGELITLRLESLDVSHGLYLDGYEINIKARPGKVGKATFVADKTGRFSFRCSETCGEFHPYMIGYLTVGPNRRYHWFIGALAVCAAGVALAVLTGRKRPSMNPGPREPVEERKESA
ncbi:MAG: ethylbenzene dehydrogenase-related protein [Planctomycetia bacterium]|nr:ethylbenzene dehydrogenase-related protein [Planctomycetia bacterium]